MTLVNAETGEIVPSTALALSDPATELERAADPGEFVVLCLERGKGWLTEALAHGDLDALVNLKGYAEVLRVATVQKQLGKDAELSAQELVRRAERAIGLGIRQGQESGTVERHGGQLARDVRGSDIPRTTTEAAGVSHRSVVADMVELADGVNESEFEEALTAAKAEGNLSRRNVVRKLKGETMSALQRVVRARQLAAENYSSQQIGQMLGIKNMGEFRARHRLEVPADAVVGRSRTFDPNRVVTETVGSLEAAVMALGIVGLTDKEPDLSGLDASQIEGWADSLSRSLKSLTTFRNKLKEQAQ